FQLPLWCNSAKLSSGASVQHVQFSKYKLGILALLKSSLGCPPFLLPSLSSSLSLSAPPVSSSVFPALRSAAYLTLLSPAPTSSALISLQESSRRKERTREFAASSFNSRTEPPQLPDPPLTLTSAVLMERVQHMTKSAIRRASQIEVNPQAKRNLQELFVNFTLILICLLLIYIIVLLSS
uniref:Phospholamban n=1 Tax=Poecilia reticulata TaxID=8081 RepID=A0A3P9P8I4_POERE